VRWPALQDIFNPASEDKVLDNTNFGKLDNLIVQTGHYSAFLFEQMKVSLSQGTLAVAIQAKGWEKARPVKQLALLFGGEAKAHVKICPFE